MRRFIAVLGIITLMQIYASEESQNQSELADACDLRENRTKPSVPESLYTRLVTDSFSSFFWEEPTKWEEPKSGYVVILKVNDLVIQNHTLYGKDNRSYLAFGLQPWTLYTFGVRAVSSDNCTDTVGDSAEISVKTDLTAPGVPLFLVAKELNVGEIKETVRIQVDWQQPDVSNGPLTGYHLKLAGGEHEQEIEVDTNSSYVFVNLHPWTSYTVSVAAFNRRDDGKVFQGPSASCSVKTEVSEPGICENVKISEVKNTSLEIVWAPPKIANGPINGYEISWRKISNPNTQFITKTSLSAAILDLDPYTEYTISVRAFNDQSLIWRLFGVLTNISSTTLPGRPSVPRNFATKVFTNTSIDLKWTVPALVNGPELEYNITLSSGRQFSLNSSSTEFKLKDLQPWTEYTVSLVAYNVVNGLAILSDAVSITQKTGPSAPPFPSNLSIVDVGETTIAVKVPVDLFSTKLGDIQNYVFLVATGSGMDMNRETAYEKYDENAFKSWNDSKASDGIYRTSPPGWNFIDKTDALCESTSDETFRKCTVGKQSECKGVKYWNAPLRTNTEYRLKIRAYTTVGWSETYPLQVLTGMATAHAPSSSIFLLLITYLIICNRLL